MLTVPRKLAVLKLAREALAAKKASRQPDPKLKVKFKAAVRVDLEDAQDIVKYHLERAFTNYNKKFEKNWENGDIPNDFADELSEDMSKIISAALKEALKEMK